MTDLTLELLPQLLTVLPTLKRLDLAHSDLANLPPSFVQAVLFHPRLSDLDLSKNYDLGCSHHSSSHCPVNRLLSKYCTAASSSSCASRRLSLEDTGMSGNCCVPVLERVLRLGSKGLEALHLFSNPIPWPDIERLIDIISNKSFFIQSFQVEGVYDNDCDWTLGCAIERNERLARKSQEAAVRVLKAARILLGSPGPSSSSLVSVERFRRRHFLDLPSELVQLVLSFLYPGALLNRQLLSIAQHAVDRDTLVQGTREWRERRIGHLKGWDHGINRVLQETGCDGCYRPWSDLEILETSVVGVSSIFSLSISFVPLAQRL